jgi:DNA-binding NarL/FixJ family response regulator
MRKDSLRIAIGIRSSLLRLGAVSTLAGVGFSITEETASAAALTASLALVTPDVALVCAWLFSDVGVRDALLPVNDIPVVVIAEGRNPRDAYKAFAAGVTSFVWSDAAAHELVAVTRAAAARETRFTASVQADLLSEIRREDENPLTRREREVLALAARGLQGQQIARALHVGLTTVKKHLQQIYEKLDAPNCAAAVAIGMSHGYIEPGGTAAASAYIWPSQTPTIGSENGYGRRLVIEGADRPNPVGDAPTEPGWV